MDVTHHSSSEPAPPVPEGAGARLQGARDAAEAVGAADVFVFRRVVGDRSVHVGGIGRGEGWAGIVELHLNDDPLAAEAHESRRPVRVASDEPTQIFGPYYAVGAALVPVSGDVMVVFGHPATELKPESDDVLRAEARRASEHLHVVAPAKRLADELELLHAVKHLMDFEGASVEEAMRHVLVRLRARCRASLARYTCSRQTAWRCSRKDLSRPSTMPPFGVSCAPWPLEVRIFLAASRIAVTSPCRRRWAPTLECFPTTCWA